MPKTNIIQTPIIGIEEHDSFTIFYNAKGDFSVMLSLDNPILQYCADIDMYYEFHRMYSNVLKILGKDCIIQKYDVFANIEYSSHKENDFLSQKYFDNFNGRKYTNISTYLCITRMVKRSAFFSFDRKTYDAFFDIIKKVVDILESYGTSVKVLNEKELRIVIYKYFSANYTMRNISLDSLIVNSDYIKIENRCVKNISLVDIDEVNFPNHISPYSQINVGISFPVDIMSFLASTPEIEALVYVQTISLPDQQSEISKLQTKKKRHESMPDPANDLCVEDINNVLAKIARDGDLLVYTNFNIQVISKDEISMHKAINYLESSLFNNSILCSKKCTNQLELFMTCLPGNGSNMAEYDLFLTTSDVAVCLMYKEKMASTEKSNFLTYFTTRNGIPIGIDISGKEGEKKITNNSNFFVLGPSGSGKSFYVNSKVRQWYLQNTDIVLVDTGHSYSGICSYYGGKYITYTEDKPITMNPFKINIEENNEEKRDFLKSLIALLWKGVDGSINQVEDTLLSDVINGYYQEYFTDKKDKRGQDIREVKSLSFNTFFEYSIVKIKEIIENKGLSIDLKEYVYILQKFYRGGYYDTILNSEFDKSLFDEKFIVFEIDNIKDNKTLFPIVTLIIMDVFIQKMNLKQNRKALIIEEAWKAIASPMMANYILYLYKTVRKKWGMAMVVTQELEDIISNPIVKNSIINNSDIICLLDQSKFKDNYDEIASLLSLSDVERKKIFTINKLDNKANRNKFNEVYIRRGGIGDVYGVEVSLHEYFTFTTERIEKDTVAFYTTIYGDYINGLNAFVEDLKKSNLSQYQWVRRAFAVLSKCSQKELVALKNQSDLCKYILQKSV